MSSRGVPSVSILILDEGDELGPLCASLAAQDYPRRRVRTETIDCGRGRRGANCNAAVARARTDFIAIVRGCLRLAHGWLTEVTSVASRTGCAAVASTAVGGRDLSHRLTFTGHPAGPGSALPDGRLLFAPAAAALYERKVFVDAGGFDDDFLGCLDDVDLGWRLNLLGHTIVAAPGALAFGDPRNSPTAWSEIRQRRLIERNALATIYKNYEAGTLERVLPAAITLCLLRGLTGSGLDTLRLELASRPPEAVDVAPELVAHLIALEDFGRQLPLLAQKRADIQRRRTRADADLWPVFGDPLREEDLNESWREIARAVIRDLGIDEQIGGHSTAAHSRTTAGVAPARTARDEARNPPTVSIVILTALGPTHVVDCLESLRGQTYPSDRIEVIVVDNGSAEDPTPAVQRVYPAARVILNGRNLGFAAGNNVGAAAASGDYLVFLNDDTRARSDWLRELVDTAERHKAAAAASYILDWSGERIDFVDASMNFQGKGFQLHYDTPAGSVPLEEKRLLFACGCALLAERNVFTEAGGWDEGTFAYYEDVELGWRLNLLGHSIVFAPRAVVHHKHHGTSGRWPEPPRVRLYERNSLRMLYEMYDEHLLPRMLTTALLLSVDRALLETLLSRRTDPAAQPHAIRSLIERLRTLIVSTKTALVLRGINRQTGVSTALKRLGIRGVLAVARDAIGPRRFTKTPDARAAYLVEAGPVPNSAADTRLETIPIQSAAILSGVYGFLSDLPAVSRRRELVQRQRTVGDLDIAKRCGSYWTHPVPSRDQYEHDRLLATLVAEFALDFRTWNVERNT
jgi:GT2 family glycosyltransferase